MFLKTAELGTSRRSHLTARYAESPLDSEIADNAIVTKAQAKNPEDVDLVEVVAEAEDADDEKLARKLTEYDDISDSIALAAVKDAQENNPEVEIELARVKRQQEISKAVVIPSGPVYDVISLVEKYGGPKEIYQNHKVAAQAGYFQQLRQLRSYLFDFVEKHNQTAYKSYVEFEHASGSKLVLVGTNHLSRQSANFTRQTVLKERPECLVIERRLGDDSLQRLTLPEQQLQEGLMSKAPSVFLSSDTEIDRARKFQTDRMWLEATPGWRDIGGEAAMSQEFGVAVEAFAQLRKDSKDGLGPRGGTLCFGDSDLRPIFNREVDTLPPSLNELGVGANIALRDLQFSQALRAALRTHKSVVGVIGDGHLAGITQLLKQDPKIRVLEEGVPLPPPDWDADLKDGGKKWEKEVLGGANLFMRLVEALDEAPLGSWMDAEAVLELESMKEETAARLEKQGLESAQPVAPVSSQLGAKLSNRGLLITPKTEADLRRWLSGQRLDGQEAGEFPFENRRLRKTPPELPSTGFPISKEEAEKAKEASIA